MKDKIVSIDKLDILVKQLKDENKKVVFTSGCFDILHAGHVAYLEEAKRKGDVLVVLLNSDDSVKMLKGDTRPIVSQEERAFVIAALESVDYVCVFGDQTPCGIIERIKPDIVVKGGDYKGKIIPEMESVKKYGGKVCYVNIVDDCSSTNIIERIKRMVKQ